VPGVDSPCSPLYQVRGGISPSRGNASKTRASLPQATVGQNRRELVAFCQQCWQFTNFRHNKGEIGILPLMVRLLIDTYRTTEHQPGRLRGELTSQEIKKYVAMCMKPGKRTGPDRCPNKLTKTMTDEECVRVLLCFIKPILWNRHRAFPKRWDSKWSTKCISKSWMVEIFQSTENSN